MIPKILDDDLSAEIIKNPNSWLVLEQHPNFAGRWIVNCLNPSFIFDFKDLIGTYRTVSPASLEAFLLLAKELSYNVVFGEDPGEILKAYEHLKEPPSVELDSELLGTINGLLPFQAEGFNFLKDLDAGVVLWSTGVGKTAEMAALLKYHLQALDYDLAWVVVKAHNKINTQRTIRRLSGIESIILDAPKKRRQEILRGLLEAPAGTVVIANYEKFRVDYQEMKPLFEGRRVLCCWDEMPTKLKSRKSKLYKSIRSLIYAKANLSVKRPSHIRQYMFTATPIENSPEDFFSCVRLLDPTIYGTITDFHNEYVAEYNYFSQDPMVWQHLEKMGLKADHIIHKIDKETDPRVKDQFPKVIEEEFYIDWNTQNKAIYNLLAQEAVKTAKTRQWSDAQSILGLITVMQMMCDAPSMISASAGLRRAYDEAYDDYIYDPLNQASPSKKGSEIARKFQDLLTKELDNDDHPKLEMLRQLLVDDHPDEQIIVFSSFNDTLLPILEEKLDEWGVSYVRYNGTNKQKQLAHDLFKCGYARVFLSSDQGSDSISLEEASVVIHYDLPWKWSTYVQRQNRAHRIVSKTEAVRFYTLLMANSVEERKYEIIRKKKDFQDQIFESAEETAQSARMDITDLAYILGV